MQNLKRRGATRHSKVFGKIKQELQKEWRDTKNKEDMNEIIEELSEKREAEEKVKPTPKPPKDEDEM